MKLRKKLPKQVVLVTGTNGKTTTSKLIKHMCSSQGLHVLHNDSGANLLNGILSTVLLNSDARGNLKFDVAVFEVDEFTLPVLLTYVSPNVIALLNLSRDQLDRHWETDIILDKWLTALSKLNPKPFMIIDGSQLEFNIFQKSFSANISTFTDNTEVLNSTSMKGRYNAKNINCALKVIAALGLSEEKALSSIASFSYAYGRGEILSYKNKNYKILLAKNPESLNQNIGLLVDEREGYDTLMFILNDNVPDGHDISWIYDVLPSPLENVCKTKNVFVSGIRAYDLAIRLSYAGVKISSENVVSDIASCLTLISNLKSSRDVCILPNYSAMLAVRKILIGRKIL